MKGTNNLKHHLQWQGFGVSVQWFATPHNKHSRTDSVYEFVELGEIICNKM